MSPRGSKKATLESLDTALKDFNASATDSELDFPRVEIESPPLFAATDDNVAAAGWKMPAHAFGLPQALGGGELTLVSSAAVSSDLGASALSSVCSASATAFWDCISSAAFSEEALEESRATAFGKAGIMGIAGKADFAGFGATGVLSPADGNEGCCVEDGVVGFVDSAASEGGRLVEGVSGRGSRGSARASSSGSALGPVSSCWTFGSSTGSADSSDTCFLFRLDFLVGQGTSGCDCHGSC